ncbi:hypothetical protein DYBT9623_00575 [Dyadobacter sp. CECT 9623]|uniref:Uncharacterized protein n=1 Tax=Dyadobacter linearis TaxID=2823330 RepID=A0ABM8UK24_9BACT|nr:hypothetical protein DYBT9623_00575 [Dyadobacter sp. CECT 9623]
MPEDPLPPACSPCPLKGVLLGTRRTPFRGQGVLQQARGQGVLQQARAQGACSKLGSSGYYSPANNRFIVFIGKNILVPFTNSINSYFL